MRGLLLRGKRENREFSPSWKHFWHYQDTRTKYKMGNLYVHITELKEQRRRHKPRLRQGEAPCSGLQPNQIHPCGAPYLYVQYAHMLPSASTCWSVQKNPSNSLLAAISKLTHVTSICKTPSNFAIRENQGRAATYIRSSP